MFRLSSLPPPEMLATYRDTRRLLGNTEDVLEILALLPSVAELEVTQTWLEDEDDDRRGRPRVAKIAAILDIVEENEPSHTR